jgi:hypothetical protein
MNPTVLKVVFAFVAGLILAFASALVYVRVQDKQQPVVAAAHVEQLPPTPQASRTTTTTPDTTSSEPVPETLPAPDISKTKKSVRTRTSVRALPRVPVQVVENKPTPENPQIAPVSDISGGPAPVSQAPPPQQAPSESPEANASDPAPTRQPHEVEITAGTNLTIRLGESLSTDGNYAGDTFRGVLAQPLIWGGFIIADRGSKVLGRVVTADKAGRMRGVSELSVTLTEINTTDGQRVTVETNLVEKRGQTSTGSDTAKIAGGAALGALIGGLSGGGKGAAIGAGAGGAAGTGLVLATRGKATTLPNEAQLSFQLASPVRITEKLNH